MTGARPTSVLFVCGLNAVRSPMAEALARRLYGRAIYIQSAGVRTGELDPFSVKVMEEVGLDISKHRPHTIEDIEDGNFDLVITLAPEAHHKALEMTRTSAMDVEYWPTPDPQIATGSRDQIMESYRSVRDGLEMRIKKRLDGGSSGG
ncbi:arsenate reductase ArsC [Siculibacillus lacustris]|uniref:Arsenate reductase ArsC n=1 Tax=Siculibacillus lacustris TaxID=1549641 RepID=A0A4Q9VUH4_9HYPH|nr:arsenate reductase ArsC [Siculibacillus lacustris]TBW38793.1 arsenate reductase ArsC [Siculibacillus lacustris]